MNRSLIILSTAFLGLLTGGCAHLDLTPEGNPDRFVTGTVEIGLMTTLPADAVVVVRVVDPTGVTDTSPTEVLGSPSASQPARSMPAKVLGEQVIKNAAGSPVPFRIEYTAMDEQLRRGINIEARVSFGGRLRYFNRNSYAITLNNVSDPHRISVDPVN